jgi:hypothetical protein
MVTTLLIELAQATEWFKGIGWSFIGIAIVKTYYVPSNEKFDISKWLRENFRDVFLGILISIAILRIGDSAIDWILGKLNATLPENIDIHAAMIVISGYLQHWLHNNQYIRKRKTQE